MGAVHTPVAGKPFATITGALADRSEAKVNEVFYVSVTVYNASSTDGTLYCWIGGDLVADKQYQPISYGHYYVFTFTFMMPDTAANQVSLVPHAGHVE